uniref:Odorant receptor n=1 Tax=Planotortrix octo TaxID=65038 RepID=A0A0B5GEX5_9NEOP|nr:olfactory receptor OR51 [Planotortrix octo]
MADILKEIHPQKYYLRLVSRLMFCFGFGTYWYEGEDTRYPRLYTVWCIIIQSYIFLVVLDLILAILRPDLSDEEKSAVIQVGFSQLLVILKFIIVVLQRHRIRDGFKKLLEEDRDIFTSLELEKESVKTAKVFFLPFMIASYSYLTLNLVWSTFVSIMHGTPIQTQITYFPTPALTGFPYNFLRILIIAHWWTHATMMITADCLCSLPIFFVTAKFKQVQMYFEILGENNLEDWSGEEFRKGFVNGIKLHQNALWCASNIQSALGILYGVQIWQTVILIGITLFQLASVERTMSNMITGLVFIVCVSLLTGAYMINSGIITYEAAKVATSMFHCGWERTRADRRLRTLLVVAVQRAQRPVYMTAFGMMNLSHESFVTVLRAAYSFFALVY